MTAAHAPDPQAPDRQAPDPRAILAERARLLARRPPPPPEGEELSVVTFVVGGESFCVEMGYVREVVRLRHVAPVPGAPPAVLGVTTYRGEILAVIDVRRLLGRPVGALADLHRIVVLGTAAPELGLLADEVVGATSLRVADLQPLSTSRGGPGGRVARAVTPDAVLVLDGGALLADSDVFAIGSENGSRSRAGDAEEGSQ